MPDRTLAIRVDDELFKRIKLRLAQEDKTLKSYIVDLVEDDLNYETTSSTLSATVKLSDLKSKVHDFASFINLFENSLESEHDKTTDS